MSLRDVWDVARLACQVRILVLCVLIAAAIFLPEFPSSDADFKYSSKEERCDPSHPPLHPDLLPMQRPWCTPLGFEGACDAETFQSQRALTSASASASAVDSVRVTGGGGGNGTGIALGRVLRSFERWDSLVNLEIAQFGYTTHVKTGCFFPLLPLATRTLARLLHNLATASGGPNPPPSFSSSSSPSPPPSPHSQAYPTAPSLSFLPSFHLCPRTWLVVSGIIMSNTSTIIATVLIFILTSMIITNTTSTASSASVTTAATPAAATSSRDLRDLRDSDPDRFRFARATAAVFALSPASVFMSVIYTEGLFAMLTFAFFILLTKARAHFHDQSSPTHHAYHVQSPSQGCSYRQTFCNIVIGGMYYAAAAVFALAASSTRSNGIVLSLFIALYWIMQLVPAYSSASSASSVSSSSQATSSSRRPSRRRCSTLPLLLLLLQFLIEITILLAIFLPSAAFQTYSHDAWCHPSRISAPDSHHWNPPPPYCITHSSRQRWTTVTLKLTWPPTFTISNPTAKSTGSVGTPSSSSSSSPSSSSLPSPQSIDVALPVPPVYSTLQRMYWGIQPFAFYRLEQVPNFIMASPVLFTGVIGLFITITLIISYILRTSVYIPRLLHQCLSHMYADVTACLGHPLCTSPLLFSSSLSSSFSPSSTITTTLSSSSSSSSCSSSSNVSSPPSPPSFPCASLHSVAQTTTLLPYFLYQSALLCIAFVYLHIQVSIRFFTPSPAFHWTVLALCSKQTVHALASLDLSAIVRHIFTSSDNSPALSSNSTLVTPSSLPTLRRSSRMKSTSMSTSTSSTSSTLSSLPASLQLSTTNSSNQSSKPMTRRRRMQSTTTGVPLNEERAPTPSSSSSSSIDESLSTHTHAYDSQSISPSLPHSDSSVGRLLLCCYVLYAVIGTVAHAMWLPFV